MSRLWYPVNITISAWCFNLLCSQCPVLTVFWMLSDLNVDSKQGQSICVLISSCLCATQWMQMFCLTICERYKYEQIDQLKKKGSRARKKTKNKEIDGYWKRKKFAEKKMFFDGFVDQVILMDWCLWSRWYLAEWFDVEVWGAWWRWRCSTSA